MNTIALIVLLTATDPDRVPRVAAPFEADVSLGHRVGPGQLAGLGHYGGVAPMQCPNDRFPSPVGHCQPDWDFD